MIVANPSLYDDLLAVRNLIAQERSFLRGDYAQDKYGFSASPIAMVACRFCLVGAMLRVAKVGLTAEETPRLHSMTALLYEEVDMTLPEFSDSHSHATVLAAIDRVLAKLQPPPFDEKASLGAKFFGRRLSRE